MQRFFKVFLVVICINIIQFCLEILFMSTLEKIGISYTGMNGTGETFKETFVGTIGYYYYSRLILFAIYTFVTTVATLYFFQHREISVKSIAMVQVIGSLLVFLVIWFSFGNSFALIANPLLGLLLAGLLIYFFASKFRKPLIRQRITTTV